MDKPPVRISITLKDIAKLAGVSIGTASKVINRQGNVSEDRRLRVEAVIEKLGYRPSALARSIKRNRTMVIGLIIPKIKNVFYIQIIDAIEKLVQARGYTLFLGNSDESLDTEIGYLRTFATMRVDGLILASSGRKDLSRIQSELGSFRSLGIPVVLIVRSLVETGLDTIVIDNEGGAYRATSYALEQGHRRIGIISSPEHTSASRERIEGYLKALEEHHVPYQSSYIRTGEISPDSGFRITKELLDSARPPTALFVASNFPLLGSLKALHDSGKRVPEDISLICFDDPEWGPFLNPPLTAVRPRSEDLCEFAVQFLFDRINGTCEGPGRRGMVGAELIIRDSVAPPQNNY